MKAIRNTPPVYCYEHGAFLEECEEECDQGASECEWYYDDEELSFPSAGRSGSG